jgi:dTDP-4-dehydrorhamnose 3,5-epimerase
VKIVETELCDAFRIELEPHSDERGFFARSFCQREFEARGLAGRFVQGNLSFNHRRGTIRGMHWQAAPHAEAKLVSCTAGAIYDVIVDLRPASPTHLRWIAVELSANNRSMLYVPEGFAHGFQTLRDDTEVFYLMSEFYVPEAGRGFRWDDPRFGIPWPEELTVISDRDRRLGFFDPASFDG